MACGEISVLAIAISMLMLIGIPAVCCDSGKDLKEPETIFIENIGARLLSEAGISQSPDISSVILTSGRKITWQDNPELVTRVYDALCAMDQIPQIKGQGAGNQLILTLRNGKTIWFAYTLHYPDEDAEDRRDREPSSVYLTHNFYSTELAPVLWDILRDAKAAERDARVGSFKARSLTVMAPGGKKVTLALSSAQGRAILSKVVVLIDWLDVRNMSAEIVTSDIIEETGKTSGLVSVSLETPVTPTVMVWSAPDAPFSFPNPIGTNISFQQVVCDQIALLDRNSPRMPRVALHDKATGRYYLSGSYLERRDIERYGVEHFGLPGHPVTDAEYYKKPEKLYAELRESVKTAVKK